MELRRREDARDWIAGGLSLSRLASLEEAQAQSGWLLEAVSESGRIPPPGIVLDLGRLFTGQPLRRSQPLPAVLPELRSALRSYEDHVLGRIEASPELDALIDAFVPLSGALRSRAVAVIVGRFASRLGFRAVSVSPGVLRSIVSVTTAELAESASAALVDGTLALEQLAGGYREFTEKAHRLGKLVTEADVFIVENIRVLADLTQRLAISEIIETSAERRQVLPRRIKARRRPKKRQVLTALSDEDHYPTGGFSSIATSGSMENLVISELIYMEDPSSQAGEGDDRSADSSGEDDLGVDLFDLRYAEGELLYYTRDDSQFVRDYRAIGFALMPDLTRARIKDRGSDHQRLIELLALTHCSIGRLSDWLSDQALHIAIRTIDDGGLDPLAAERGLLEVLLGEDIERGLVSIERATSLDDALDSQIGDARASPEWVVATTDPSLEPPPDAVTTILRMVGPTPATHWSGLAGGDRELSDWDDATLAILQRLV